MIEFNPFVPYTPTGNGMAGWTHPLLPWWRKVGSKWVRDDAIAVILGSTVTLYRRGRLIALGPTLVGLEINPERLVREHLGSDAAVGLAWVDREYPRERPGVCCGQTWAWQDDDRFWSEALVTRIVRCPQGTPRYVTAGKLRTPTSNGSWICAERGALLLDGRGGPWAPFDYAATVGVQIPAGVVPVAPAPGQIPPQAGSPSPETTDVRNRA